MTKPPTATPVPAKAYDKQQAAAAMTVSRATIDRLISTGELRAKKIGTRVVIPVEAIDEYLAGQ